MATISSAQITIMDYQDIIVQNTEPTSPKNNMLWLDTSIEPNKLKKYNGSTWDNVNDMDSIIQATQVTASTSMETALEAVRETERLEEEVVNAIDTSEQALARVDEAFINAANALEKAQQVDRVNAQVTEIANTMNVVFTSTPTVPYKKGDLWVQGSNGDILTSTVTRTSGSYTVADWVKANKYTDDSKAIAVATQVEGVEGRVTSVETKASEIEKSIEGFRSTVSSTYSTKTELSTTNTNVANAQSTASAAQTKANTVATDLATTNSNVTKAQTKADTVASDLAKTNTTVANNKTDIENKLTTSIATVNTTIATEVEQLEDSISLKASSTTVNTLNDKVTSLQTDYAKFKVDTNAITSTVTEVVSTAKAEAISSANANTTSAINTVNNNLSTTNTNVTKAQTTANAAQTKANTVETNLATTNSNLSALTTRVSTAEQKITKDAIISSVTETITQAKNDAISSANSNTTSAINNLEIGGRNLLRNSAFINTTDLGGWAFNKTYSNIDTTTKFNNHNTIKVAITGLTADQWIGATSTGLSKRTFKPGETVTLSAWYYVANKSTLDDRISIGIQGKIGGETNAREFATNQLFLANIVEGKWTKITVTYTFPNEAIEVIPRCWVKRNGTVWFADFKFELGNKATDWVPAIEDVDSDINTVATNLSTTNSNVTKAQTTANAAQTKANTVETNLATTNSNLSALTTRVSTAEQKITKDAIISSVTETITTAKNDAISSANANTTSAVKTVNDRVTATNTSLATTNSNVTTAQNTANAAQTKANTVETNLATTNSNLSNLTTRVASAEQKITKDAIINTVTETITTAKNDAISSATSTALANAKAEIGKIQVGGRNLIRNADMKTAWATWNNRSTTSLLATGTKVTNVTVGQMAMVSPLATSTVVGNQYTLTFKARGNLPTVEGYLLVSSGTNYRAYYTATGTTVFNTTTFKEISITFTVPSTATTVGNLFLGGTATAVGQWLEVAKDSVKLELGNIKTDFTLAQEDIEKQVETVATNLATTNGNVTTAQNTANAAQTKANTVATDLAATNVRMSSAETKLTASSLTTTISTGLAGSNSISTTKFVMDKNGLTIKNGGLKIQNASGVDVLTASTDGVLFAKDGAIVVASSQSDAWTNMGYRTTLVKEGLTFNYDSTQNGIVPSSSYIKHNYSKEGLELGGVHTIFGGPKGGVTVDDALTVTGNANVTGGVNAKGGIGIGATGTLKLDTTSGSAIASNHKLQAPSMELRAEGTPYLDFTNENTTDYDARIILTENDILNFQGARLNVDHGGVRANGWFTTLANVGWYNETWGGGWNMTDATWIRSYGSKNVYVDKILRVDGGIQVGENTNVVSSGSNTNGRWTRYYDGLQICYGDVTIASEVGFTTSTSGLYTNATHSNKTYTFPVTFTTSPIVTVTGHSNGYLSSTVGSVTTTNFMGRLYAHSSITMKEVRFQYTAIGRWK